MGWWVAHAERTLTEEVPAPPAEVRDFYVDLDNLKLVHPLIVSVRELSSAQTPDGYQRTYRVVDRIPLGRWTVRVGYRARLRVPARGEVITEANRFPAVRLRGAVAFAPVAAGTAVTERVRISAPRPLAAVIIREAVTAHVAMLAGIRRHFESC
ncbi:SRPBCC family protein [Mycobacterium spongiae]|uniref:SRPBCC family protein n=1 Tax=Mycobacterium spongiae TaxID=886343 RepID=A0A975PVC5_9MYCO|nr:SRPBCC family protein [Mycobacterium spongiae]QUR65862.1 SRPBCC family protein [Mycobacterium spongiae]